MGSDPAVGIVKLAEILFEIAALTAADVKILATWTAWLAAAACATLFSCRMARLDWIRPAGLGAPVAAVVWFLEALPVELVFVLSLPVVEFVEVEVEVAVLCVSTGMH